MSESPTEIRRRKDAEILAKIDRALAENDKETENDDT